MSDYNIRVRIDPSESRDGSRVIRTELEGIRTAAEKTTAAVQKVGDVNPAGLTSGANQIENNLDEINRAAQKTGVAVERALDFSGVRLNLTPAISGLDGLALKADATGAAVKKIQWTGSAQFIGQFGAADNAVERLEAEILRLKTQLDSLSQKPSPVAKIGPSMGQTQQATLQAGQQFQDFAQQVTLGINPITAFTQQSGQMAFAMSNMGGAAGTVGRFLAGPWGTLVLVGASVLGQFVYKMLDSKQATDEARDALDEYGQEQQDLANFVDLATGRIIAQTTAVRLLTLAQIENKNEAERGLADKSKTATFEQANEAATVRREFTAERQPSRAIYDPKLQKAISDANGDVTKLIDNVNKAGPQYQKLAKELTLTGKDAITFQQAQARVNAEMELLRGRTDKYLSTNARYIQQQADAAAATTERERAEINLRRVQESGQNRLDAGDQTYSGDQYRRDLDAAHEKVKRAIADEKALKDAKKETGRADKEVARYDEAIRRLEAEESLLRLYGQEYEIRKAQISIENTLGRGLSDNEAKAVAAIVKRNDAARAEGDILRGLLDPIEKYKVQIKALSDLLDQGRISQEQYNSAMADLPVQQALDQIDQTLFGAADKYDAQLRRLSATINKAIQTIKDAETLGLITPDEAKRKIADLKTQGGSGTDENGDIVVTGGESTTTQGRGNRAIDLAQRKELNQIDQGIGGQIGKNAEREAIQLDYEQRLNDLQNFYGASYTKSEEYAKREAALKRKMANDTRQFALAERATRVSAAASMFDTLTGLAREFAGEQSGIYKALFAASKAFAIAQSIIDIQKAIADAFADGTTVAQKIAGAAAIVSATASIVSNIRSVSLAFRDGGYVTGEGGPRDDKVLARLSAGEFVVNAPATSRNRPILEAMNQGRDYSGPATSSTKVSGGGGFVLQVGDINVSVEGSGDPQQDGQVIGQAVKEAIKGVVREELVTQSRSGGMLTRQRQSSLTS